MKVDIRQLTGQIPAGGTGIKGDNHPLFYPRKRLAGDVRFVRVVAFQTDMKRVAAVTALPVNDFCPTVVTQHFPLGLELAEIAANGFSADVKL